MFKLVAIEGISVDCNLLNLGINQYIKNRTVFNDNQGDYFSPIFSSDNTEITGLFYKYGQKLEFVHNINNFDESSQDLLKFILKYAEIMKLSNKLNRYDYYSSSISMPTITLGKGTLDKAFDMIMEDEEVMGVVSITQKEKTDSFVYDLNVLNLHREVNNYEKS